jgi:hypothetical protein
MPPEENKNNNPVKIGLDPVFKSNPNLQKPTNSQVVSGAFNVLNNQQFTPTQTNTVPTKPIITNSPKSIVRTFKGDMAAAITANHLSSINIAIAENQKMNAQVRAEQKENPPSGEYSKNKITIFISIILIIIGITGVSLVYVFRTPASEQAIKIQTLPSLITTEYKDELNLEIITSSKIITVLSEKLNTAPIPVNNLYNAYITIGSSTSRRLVTAPEFITLMKFHMPDMIRRTLFADFMVGTYTLDKNLPFIILKTSSFENTYAGMLNWELDLEKDFQILFRLPGYENQGGILANLAPTISKKFADAVIVNKDVRVLRGDEGKIIFLYGIIDKETIVITVNDVAFKEIINRLDKEKTLKR